ncbi:MAG: AMP-binding protein, partial [Ketobacteraceae bacterium]|nr:AMP-binding protein [Ketobacteraceae bacterium]
GATVPVELAARMTRVFPNALAKVVYGSTESEPISSVEAQEFVRDSGSHLGFLVGKPVKNVEVCVASLPDRPVDEAEVNANQLKTFDIGEILVSGEHVLKAYVDNVSATRENKVRRGNGSVWHRTGDTGFFDEQGRIWLTGRVKDVVTANGNRVQPFPLEKAIDEMAGIKRSALIQSGDQISLFIEPGIPDRPDFFEEIAAVLKDHGLGEVKISVLKKIPVDARHNSKIDRPLIRNWMAQGKIDYKGVIS